MLVRCAYRVGTVRPKDQERVDAYVRDTHVPDVAKCSRLRRLRLLKNNGQPYLGEAPRYCQCFELTFDTQEDMDFCMRSPERAETRRISQGDVHHVNYAVTEF